MSRNLSISETGLRLIKAFEGYRPVDRELVTGARVVGYGHRVHDERPRAMSRDEAEDTLKLDLAAYEEMINEEVHAPLSQSQFDALCSLAFNIGPKAFRGSDTVRALNNGRVLDAANGFDVWRKATINGDTYVVDALMRRRTAEKSLFLRTEKGAPAGAALDLQPDADVAALTTDDGLPVFTEDMRAGVIAKAPYEATDNPMRRREDQTAGILTLSEIVEPEAENVVEIDETTEDVDAPDVMAVPKTDTPRSVIGEAADALSERLEALIDTGEEDTSPADDPDWPQSLIQAIGDEPADAVETDAPSAIDDAARGNLVAFPTPTRSEPRAEPKTPAPAPVVEATPDTTLVIDDLAADDIMRDSRASTARMSAAEVEPDIKPVSGIWIPTVLGFAVFGASVAALVLGARELLGASGPVLALAGVIVGALMILYSLYLATAGRMESD